MLVTVEGILTAVKAPHSLNALASMISTPSGRFTLFKLAFLENALAEIVVTPSGIVTSVKPASVFANAFKSVICVLNGRKVMT